MHYFNALLQWITKSPYKPKILYGTLHACMLSVVFYLFIKRRKLYNICHGNYAVLL